MHATTTEEQAVDTKLTAARHGGGRGGKYQSPKSVLVSCVTAA